MENTYGRATCVSCGADISANSLYCANCGARQTQGDGEGNNDLKALNFDTFGSASAGSSGIAPAASAAPATPWGREEDLFSKGQTMDFGLFWEQYAAKGTKGWDKALWILLLVSAALSLVSGLLISPLSLVDAVIFGALGFFYKKKRSKKLALVATVLCGLSTLLGLISGSVTGIVILIAAVQSYLKLGKLEKAYQDYLASGITPAAPI